MSEKRGRHRILASNLKQDWMIMTLSDRSNTDELEVGVKERIAELEKDNQELRAEILECKQEKHRIHRYNSILEGINRIFGSFVKAETEGELENACLAVAMEITGSQLGFLCEEGADGLMHNIAVSYMGGNQYVMNDKTGHCLSFGNFVLRSLCGNVLDSGKGFFTNDPSSHPYSIGALQGYPQLTSYLGVPLILDGKTVGMIVVANRKGGYSCEQQEDLEAIASAVMQVLQRKKAEQKREQVKKAPQEREESYRSLYENSLDGILLTKPDGTILSANPQACYLFGMTEDEIIKAGRESLVVKDKNLEAALGERELTGRAKAELTFIRKDGSKFVGEASFSLFKDIVGRLKTTVIIRDITERKKAEETLLQSEQRIRLKLDIILSPDREIASLKLSEIVDAHAIQSLMDDFYKLAHIPMSLDDLRGNILVGVGWQDICTKFHRVNPEACRHCKESDTKLSVGIPSGEFKLYKCKNNMWDIATPIIVGGHHVGNIFSGQFFFEGEPLDYELFRSQARRYGFNEEEYLAALEKVPRLSKEAVETGMSFFMRFANMISQLSYSNIKLAQSLAERDSLMEALRESEKRERARSDELAAVLDAVPVSVYITHDSQALKITGNRLSYEWLGIPVGTNLSKSAPEGERPETFSLFKDGMEIPPADMPSQRSSAGIEINNCELDIVSADGAVRHVLGNARPLRDEQGNPHGSISAFIDITERKKAEEALLNSEERYRMLFTNMTDGFGLVEVICNNESKPYDYRYLEINPAFERYLGVKREQMLGKTMLELFPDVSPIAIENYEEVALSGNPANFEIFSEIAKKYLDIYAFIPEKGKLALILRNITERKEAENKLRAALDNLGNLVKERTSELERAYNSLKEIEIGLDEAQKMARIGNWDWNLVTGEMYWSDGLYIIFGRSPQESGASLNELLSYMHPDDIDNVDNAIRKRLSGKTHGIDYRIVLANGEERTVHGKAEVICDKDNIPVRVKGIIQDITERKKAEERIQILANAVESSNDAILTLTLEGIVTSWNMGAEQVYGYSAEEILGKNISIVEPDNLKGEIKRFTEKIRHGEKIQRYETLRLKKDGILINISATLSPVFNASGKLVAISAISRDITKRVKAEEALEKIEEARKKEIHHRIKNNLQVISSLLDLQAEKFRDKNVLEAFRESQNRVISMALIHEELYKGKGTDALYFPAYLQKLAENLFQTYSIKSRNIRLYTDLEKNAFFDMDTAVPLGIIVNELVSNSLKHAFSENQEGEIRVRLCREEENNEIHESLFSLTISDNGKGLPQNIELESLESLGLQLVNTLVDQLDGEIEIKQERGTEFRIIFKVVEDRKPANQ